MNASVWLGTTVFFTFGASPACFSSTVTDIFKVGPDSYYPNVIAQAIMTKYYAISLACAVVALLHFVCKWLYMGRPSRKFSAMLVISLFVIMLIGSNAIQPALGKLNEKRFKAPQQVERQ